MPDAHLDPSADANRDVSSEEGKKEFRGIIYDPFRGGNINTWKKGRNERLNYGKHDIGLLLYFTPHVNVQTGEFTELN
jgi:hypothetical protein